MAADPPPPPPPPPVNVTASPSNAAPVRIMQFNPALAVVVLVTIICFFIAALATSSLKRCAQRAEADTEDGARRHSRSRTGGPTSKSLDPEILKALPRVRYKDLPADEQVQKYFDCPVCLAPFDSDDTLRLLPVCAHAFHSDCIEAWFLSHNTCPLCRACLALQTGNKENREERGDNNAENAGEQIEISVPEGFDVIEVVISGDTEQDRSGSARILGFLEDRIGGAAMSNSSTMKKEEGRVHELSLPQSDAGRSFMPAVRIVTTTEKAAALATIRRSNSVDTFLQLLHYSYVIDSEGTQHYRNDQTHAMDGKEFLVEDHHGADAQPSESSSRHPITLAQHWLPVDLGRWGLGVNQPISRLGTQLIQSTRWSYPNLRNFAPA